MSITTYEPKPIKNRLIALLVVGVLIFGVTKLFPDNPPAFLQKTTAKTETSTPDNISQLKGNSLDPNTLNKNFEISELKMVNDDSWPRLTGLVKNISKSNFQDVTLTVNTYESNNKFIQTHYSEAYLLEAGQSWKFELPLFDKNTAFYYITDIRGQDITGKTTSTPGLKIVSSELAAEGKYQYVTGIIENKSKMDFDEATVKMSIMDKAGTVMQYSSADIFCFESGQKWKFKIDVNDYIAYSYKLTEVKGKAKPDVQHFAPGLEVVNSSFYLTEYNTKIKGTIKNNSLNHYSYASLIINVFDKKGYLLTSIYENHGALSSGSSWNFDVNTYSEDIGSFKIAEMQAN